MVLKERAKVIDGIAYEVRNIVVNPKTPHLSAKTLARAEAKASTSP